MGRGRVEWEVDMPGESFQDGVEVELNSEEQQDIKVNIRRS
jgi:hypothetical protein